MGREEEREKARVLRPNTSSFNKLDFVVACDGEG